MNKPKKLIIILIMISLAITGLIAWFLNSNNSQQTETSPSIEEQKTQEQEISQNIDSILNDTAKPEAWTESDCSIKDNSYSPGSYTIKTLSYSPASDPAKGCDDYTNVFYITYGVENGDVPCDTPQQVKDYKVIDPPTDKSGCVSVELGQAMYSRVVTISRISRVEYISQKDKLMSVKYYADDRGNLPYIKEVEKYISNIKL